MSSGEKWSYLTNPATFWTGRFINYQGIIGRPIIPFPLMDVMSIFAEKKAHILVQDAKFIFSETLRGDVQVFLQKLPLTQLFQDCIQQASMNGYAVVDIERIVWNEHIQTFIFVNPFPSIYDQWNYDTLSTKINALAFQTCLNTQRFKTPNIAMFSKDYEKFNIMNWNGTQDKVFMVGGWGFDTKIVEPMSYFNNENLQNKTIYYNQLKYKDHKVWPYINKNHSPFYLFRNRQFTLGYKNEVQNSDMWFLNSLGYLIPSALERAYQEQEVNITRIIGQLDPQMMETNQDFKPLASETDKLLKGEGTFSTSRSIQFTIGDGQQVVQQPSTFQGPQEIQTFKDWMDVAFKLVVGFDLYGESATRESTATENLQRSVSDRENLTVLTNWYKKQMKEAIMEALFYTFGDTFEDYFDIRVDSQRGNVSPAEVQSILGIYGQGLMSKELAVRKLNPNMTDREIKEELERLDIQEQQQLQEQQLASPSMSSPEATSADEESGNRLNE